MESEDSKRASFDAAASQELLRFPTSTRSRALLFLWWRGWYKVGIGFVQGCFYTIWGSVSWVSRKYEPYYLGPLVFGTSQTRRV